MQDFQNNEEFYIRKSPKKTIFRSHMRRDSLTSQEYKSPARKIILSKHAVMTPEIQSIKGTEAMTTDVSDNVSENHETK